MATTQSTITEWFESGIENEHKWMLVVCDTFDYVDYPVYADSVAEFDSKYERNNGVDMQRVMEVYDLSLDLASQIKAKRNWSYPTKSKFNPNKPKDINPVIDWLG